MLCYPPSDDGHRRQSGWSANWLAWERERTRNAGDAAAVYPIKWVRGTAQKKCRKVHLHKNWYRACRLPVLTNYGGNKPFGRAFEGKSALGPKNKGRILSDSLLGGKFGALEHRILQEKRPKINKKRLPMSGIEPGPEWKPSDHMG